MSTIDEDDHERERKHALSIVPSSYSNLPSGLEGLGADAQNHYHHQPPPFSVVSGASAGMFSDLLSEAGASTGPGVEEWSPEEPQKEDPLSIQKWRLYARTKVNLPANGESHVADGGQGSETTTTRRADPGAPTPTTTVPTRPDDAYADEGAGAGGT